MEETVAEQSLLAAIIIDPQRFAEVEAIVKPDMFKRQSNGRIYTAMRQININGNAIDIVSLREYLSDKQIIDQVGGLKYLMDICDYLPTSANIMTYADIVRRNHAKRICIANTVSALEELKSGEKDTFEVISKLIGEMEEATRTTINSSTIDEIMEDAIAEIANRTELNKKNISSGLSNIDKIHSGFRKGELSIIGARPSMGKSALALQIARFCAFRNVPTLYISIEMSRNMVAHRLLSVATGIPGNRISNEVLSETERDSIGRARDVLKQLPLHISAHSPCDISLIRGMATKLKRTTNLGVVVVDYLQMIDSAGAGENRTREIGIISRGLKALAKELDVAVIALSSLSRRVEQRDDKRPIMSDLRESGDIESDADMVAFLYRPMYYADPAQKEGMSEEECEYIVSKNRNGPTGTARLTFFNQKGVFDDAPDMGQF